VRGLVVDEGVREGRLGTLARGEPAVLDHGVEDVARALLGVGRLLLTQSRVVEGGATDRGREEGALGHGQLGHVLVEVRRRRGLDAVGAPTVVDGVEVVLEDLVLGLLAVDLHGEEDLAGLAVQGAVGGEEVVLHVLLGDRGATLRRGAALDGDPHGAGDARRGDAVVLVERLVLTREDRLLHVIGDLGQRHRHAVALAVGQAPQLRLAVGVVDDGRLGRGDLVRLGDVGARVGDPHGGHAEDRQGEHGPQAATQPGATAGAAGGCRRAATARRGRGGTGLALTHAAFRGGERRVSSRSDGGEPGGGRPSAPWPV
jgi:hypothetical protein